MISTNKLIHLFQFVILVCLLQGNSQNVVHCYFCKEIIKSKYIIVDSKAFHQEHFLCKSCNKPITGSFTKKDENYFHPECFSQIVGLVCEYCKKIIQGEYLVNENKKYHKLCFENFVVPKCAVCKSPLVGEYREDIYHNKYHAYHSRDLYICDCCDRIICDAITNGGKTYNDGRHICNICYSSAIFEQKQFEKLLEKVSFKLNTFGMNFNLNSIKIKGVDKNVLRNAAKIFTESTQGYCQSETTGNYLNERLISQKIMHTIFVLNGIPSLHIESIIAHELAHAWIYEKGKKNLSPKTLEGSCNFVSYTYLKSIGQSAAYEIIKMIEMDPDPNYGKGFLEIRDKFGYKPFSDFLAFLRNN
jgi:hypothetical protein